MIEREAVDWILIKTLAEWGDVMGPWASEPAELPCAVMGVETEEGTTYCVMYPEMARKLAGIEATVEFTPYTDLDVEEFMLANQELMDRLDD